MRLQAALKLCLVGSTASWGVVLAQEAEERRRSLKEQAVHFVERFLRSIQASNTQEETTRVLWNGKYFTPIKDRPENRMRKLSSEGHSKYAAEQKGAADTRGKANLQGRIRSSSRRNRNYRKIKGDKSLKGEDPDALKVFTKKTKGTKAEPPELVTCFQGLFFDVYIACEQFNANCCIGEVPCFWEGLAVVCQDSCIGNEACVGFPEGTEIDAGACNGYRACYYMASDSAECADCDPVTVGRDSCLGDQACDSICRSSNACELEIGDNSCTDDDKWACSYVSATVEGPTTVKIEDNSCNGYAGCYSIGRENTHIESVVIEKDACNGDISCCEMGRKGSGSSISVEEDSCIGYGPCISFGEYAQGPLDIASDSCLGLYSCPAVGVASSGASVGKKACLGDYACTVVGRSSEGTVEIDDKACTDLFACYALGAYADAGLSVEIGKKACNDSPNQCSAKTYAECGTTAVIPPNADSCYAS